MSANTESAKAAWPVALRSSGHDWQWGWALAVVANLPVPLLFGFAVVAHGGLFGMLAGIVAFWLVGAAVVACVPRLRAVLVYGGAVLALTQVLPVLQIVAGVVAVELFDTTPEPMSELTGFLVTLVTGGQLALVVLLCRVSCSVLGWLGASWLLRVLGQLGAGHPQRDPS